MPLTQPDRFSDLEAGRTLAVGEDVPRHVEPVGIDGSNRLHVRCSSPAWRTQPRLIGAAPAERANEVLPPRPEIAGVVVRIVSGVVPRTHRPAPRRPPRLITALFDGVRTTEAAAPAVLV